MPGSGGGDRPLGDRNAIVRVLALDDTSAVIIFVRLAIGSRRAGFRRHSTRPLRTSNRRPARGLRDEAQRHDVGLRQVDRETGVGVDRGGPACDGLAGVAAAGARCWPRAGHRPGRHRSRESVTGSSRAARHDQCQRQRDPEQQQRPRLRRGAGERRGARDGARAGVAPSVRTLRRALVIGRLVQQCAEDPEPDQREHEQRDRRSVEPCSTATPIVIAANSERRTRLRPRRRALRPCASAHLRWSASVDRIARLSILLGSSFREQMDERHPAEEAPDVGEVGDPSSLRSPPAFASWPDRRQELQQQPDPEHDHRRYLDERRRRRIRKMIVSTRARG